ncbi:MAG: DUF5681 domain-containing protein [Rhizorhabdus sp.]
MATAAPSPRSPPNAPMPAGRREMAGERRKRASRATGVGRGNGEGSKAGQFQAGEPSRNPHGRPKREKCLESPDLRGVLRQMLEEKVPVRKNGVSQMMPQQQAMAELMLKGFAQASLRDQLALMRLLLTTVVPTPAEREMVNRDIPAQSIAEFVQDLAREHERLERDGLL